MFYAKYRTGGEFWTARFYSRTARDQFVADKGEDAFPVRSKTAKFAPGSDRHVTYDHRRENGEWMPL
ncbi:MAG: hypothetical protein NVV83_10270 [Afipia sp.]|nr:hypothetical protein [Afipia sp.]